MGTKNPDPLILPEAEKSAIGIPNIPLARREYEEAHARYLLERGICPKHKVKMSQTENEEYCPYCEAEADDDSQ